MGDGDSARDSEKTPTVREVIRDPYWWIRDVLTALIIGGLLAVGSIVGQKLVDDRRAERQMEAAMANDRHDLQLENLRFVRDRSWGTPDGARLFAGLDLSGQNLVGLPLTGSDFAVADLSGANLSQSDLSNSNFARANLRSAELGSAKLRDAYLGAERIPDATDQRGADLTDADLTGADLTGADLSQADLSGANLSRVVLTGVYYDSGTKWPEGFIPPPSRPQR